MFQRPFSFRSRATWVFLSILSGCLSGAAATVFLYALDWATTARERQEWIVWLLPAAGLAIGLLFHYLGREVESGSNLILDEIHDPQKVVPARMAPLILLSTVITHLFGGSAGREGTAVQMGASLSDQLTHIFPVGKEERRILLSAGTGAGFGAAIGAPWAGMIFGMEVIHGGSLRFFAWLECFIASFAGFLITVLFRAPHSIYPLVEIPALDFRSLAYIAAAGIAFGLVARSFIWATHLVERVTASTISPPLLRPAVGGMLVAVFYFLAGTHQYEGLGISSIRSALLTPAGFAAPAMKAMATALTLGTGLKGGEFIPLVFIGTTAGSALAVVIPLSFALLGAVGFAAVFAGAANTPLACSIMAAELFGARILPFALTGCLASYLVSGNKGIYRSQKSVLPKHHRLLAPLFRGRK